MPKQKRISGKELIKQLRQKNCEVIRQTGSHIVLRHREYTFVVPNHIELDKGTLRAIQRQTSVFLSEKEILEIFYNE